MRIIPVMDLLKGLVVHAKGGVRSSYKPLKSPLCSSPSPLELAEAFDSFGFRELYVADLDAIQKKGANLEIIKRICKETNLSLMVDAGIRKVKEAEELYEAGISKVIIGTETLCCLELIREVKAILGGKRTIVSLDFRGGRLISPCSKLNGLIVSEAVKLITSCGVRGLILLDLEKVGSLAGPNKQLITQALTACGGNMREWSEKVNLLVGGGISGIEDLNTLEKLNVSGALLASSIHKGRIDLTDLKKRFPDSFRSVKVKR